jgi:hypothetical protein
MRTVIGLIAIVSMGAAFPVFATEPEPQQATSTPNSSPQSPPPSSTTQPSTPGPAAADSAASTTAEGKPPVVVQTDKNQLTHEEQQLISRGYKLEVRNGEKWFCRREQMLGSRLNEVKHCGTASMLAESTQRQKEETRNAQHITTPSGH